MTSMLGSMSVKEKSEVLSRIKMAKKTDSSNLSSQLLQTTNKSLAMKKISSILPSTKNLSDDTECNEGLDLFFGLLQEALQ